MDEGEQVPPDARRLRRHYPLGRHRGDCSIDGVAAIHQNLPAGLGRQMVWRGDRVGSQETLRSGSRRFKASRTARTTALVSSSSAYADPMSMRSPASVTRTT